MTRVDGSAGVRELTEQDLGDIVNGACLFGAGGGGPWSLGNTLVGQIIAAGKPVWLADPASMPATAFTCVSAGVGSPDAAAGGFPYDAGSHALAALASETSTSFAYVLPAELGAANSIVPMTTAAIAGIPILDAAGSPRAVPQLTQSTFATRGAPIGTVVLANASQRVSFDGHDPATADDTMRQIISSGAFKQDAGAALWAMDGATMQRVAMPGTTTEALRLGATLRAAKASGDDPVAAVSAFLGGTVLIRGQITSQKETTGGGFDIGVLTVSDGDGASLRIVNQNENMLAWPEDSTSPTVLAPDLICFMTVDGQPFSNADRDLAKGKDIAVIAAPVAADYRDPAVLAAFLPVLRGAGYDGPYVPIEELLPGA